MKIYVSYSHSYSKLNKICIHFRNNTSLGLALADAPGEKIRISSIQPGSLAERCGYLKPGDVLISIQVKEDKTVSCSPYYTSFETAQIIRGITSSMPSMVLTILPYEAEQLQLQQQHISLFNMLSTAGNVKYKKEFGSESTLIPDSGQNENVDLCGANNFHDNSDDASSKDRRADEENYSVLSFSLWKDRLYEDWGFSLSDSMESQEDSHGKENYEGCKAIQSSPSSSSGKTTKKCQREAMADSGSEILQIRPGGPAYAAGIQPGDKIIQVVLITLHITCTYVHTMHACRMQLQFSSLRGQERSPPPDILCYM